MVETITMPYTAKLEEFFSENYKSELESLAQAFPEKRSLVVDFSVLDSFDPALADELIEKPYAIIKAAEEAIFALNIACLNGAILAPHVRFVNLPSSFKRLVRDVNSTHINRFLSVDGVVTKIKEVKPKIVLAAFECKHCRRVYKIAQQEDKLEALVEPTMCACERKSFSLLLNQSSFIDVQVNVEIQEPLEILKGSEQAKKIELWLEDDLTNKIIPGDVVEVVGTLLLKHPKFKGSIYEKFLDVNSVTKKESEFEEIELSEQDKTNVRELAKDARIYEKIVASIAPSIYGHKEIKEAIALQLFGGTRGKVKADGIKIRSDMHILLIGDPGAAKTQLLRYVRDLAPKGIYVSGRASSGAGMTASAEKDDKDGGGWTLKAGALVLAAGGHAMVDEFDKMSDDDRSAMHEAMESQVISVAKAGIVATFKANSSILAAANPKFGRFNDLDDFAEQFNIPPTILSRFDLIFPVKDKIDEVKDRETAEHMLTSHRVAGWRVAKKADDKELKKMETRVLPIIEQPLLRKYIALARREINPVLTEEAEEKIKSFYLDMRKLGEKQSTIPITARYLEALIRLAEASAKGRFSPEVQFEDADRGIRLLTFCMKQSGVDPATGQFDVDRLTTGVSGTKRNKMQIVYRIVKKLAAQFQTAPKEKIWEAAKEEGIAPDELEELLNTLRKNGELYSPKHGDYVPTEKY